MAGDYKTAHYLVFDGIPTRLSDYPDMATLLADGNTYLHAMEDVPGGVGTTLDRQRGIILPGGFDLSVEATTAVQQLLRFRGGTESALTASPTESATTLSFDTTGFSNGDVVYLDQETVLLGTVGAGSVTGCTRGHLGSQAKAHQLGAIVSTVPRFWKGRRAKLYTVDLKTNAATLIRTAILIDSPPFNDGGYQLSFIDPQTQLNRHLYVGWEPQKIVSANVYLTTNDTIELYVGDARHFSASADGYIKTIWPDGFEVHKLRAANVDTGNNKLTIDAYSRIESYRDDAQGLLRYLQDSEADQLEIEVQQVHWDEDTPANIALKLMLSDLGAGANNPSSSPSYDEYPGVTPALTSGTSDINARRIGAALPEDWVDLTTWEALNGIGGVIRLFIDESVPLLDFLAKEIAPRLGGYISVNAAGQISFQRYLPAVPESGVLTMGEDDIFDVTPNVVYDEGEAVGSALVRCNWSPELRKFLRTEEVTFGDVAARWGTNRPYFQLEMKTLWIGDAISGSRLVGPPAGSQIDVVTMLDRIYSRTRNGIGRISGVSPWSKHNSYLVGKRVNYTDSRLPDGEGGMGIANRQHEIVGVTVDPDNGDVKPELEEQPQGWLVAPSFIVLSWDAPSKTITIDQTGDEAIYWDVDPGSDMAKDWNVRVHDESASPPKSVSEVEAVASVTASTIVLVAAPSAFTPGPGDLVRLEFSANTGETNAIGADVQDHLFQVDANGLLDAGGGDEREGTRWA